MNTVINQTAPTSTTRPLTALRDIAVQPTTTLAEMLVAADRQAELLTNLLSATPGQLLHQLAQVFPDIRITHVEDLPTAGIAFWARKRWNIQVRASDAVDRQAFAALHELKHIIDHPIRRLQTIQLSDTAWEMLADHFATQLLARPPDGASVEATSHKANRTGGDT
jgi:hypothetical protein